LDAAAADRGRFTAFSLNWGLNTALLTNNSSDNIPSNAPG